MKISSISNQNHSSSQPAFGAKFSNVVKNIVSEAYFSSYRTQNKNIIESTAKRTEYLRKTHPEYVLTTYLDGYKGNDFYNFLLTPLGLNKNCGKVIAKIPNKTSALVMLEKLEQAFQKFKP